MADPFTAYNPYVFHCRRCHKIVTTDDAHPDDIVWQALLLDAHLAFNCRTDPYASITRTPTEGTP